MSGRAEIRGVAYALPDQVLTNEMLGQEHPDWDMQRVMRRTGVATRYVTRHDETAYDLARRACDKLLAEHPGLRSRIDTLLFCTQSQDHLLPGDSALLHGYLDLAEDVLALDFSLACSGFVYGLALAQSLIVAGMATDVLLVTADTYSKYVHPADRSSRTLFGDGAAATWLSVTHGEHGTLDVQCATSGKDHRLFMVPAGGCRMPRTPETAIGKADITGSIRSLENIHMDGGAVLRFVESAVPRQVRDLLKSNGLAVEDLDLVIFHQASRVTIDSLSRALELPEEKVFSNLRDIGNTVSASIPIAYRQAADQGRLRPGALTLLCGFGVGMSWATALVRR